MISEITYITGNEAKFNELRQFFEKTEISLLREKVETPELQTESVSEITEYKAKIVGEKLNRSLITLDRGFYIESLNNFPGAFVKYANKWFSADQILKLMEGVKNRKSYWESAVGLYLPGKEVKVYSGKNYGVISDNVGEDHDNMMDMIFVPDGYEKTLSEFGGEERVGFWNNTSCWGELIECLKNEN